MPLRDHFRPPLSDRRSWDEVHGLWPSMIVLNLSRRLPDRFVAAPRIHLGPFYEVDVATFEEEAREFSPYQGEDRGGGVATASWAPPEPTGTFVAGSVEPDAYEVRVYDTRRGRRLVAAVEIVSPANEDRPDHRRAFAAKCVTLLQDGVCVVIVDIVTARAANLFADLMEFLGQPDRSMGDDPPPLYAVACRWADRGDVRSLETWAYPLALGQPMPILPLWLAEDLAVPLELEITYEETCRVLRIP